MGVEIADHAPKKLGGYDFYREVLGSPKYVVAPMVDQSELVYATRRPSDGSVGGMVANIAGVHADDPRKAASVDLDETTILTDSQLFADPNNKYRGQFFDIKSGEEGDPATDRPLIVQFCANDPEYLLTSAKVVEKHCDAVDINLGCPQEIARRGRYGSFLQDDWDTIFSLINTLHKNLAVPVTAKFRVFPSIEKTVEYAQMLERAGAQILTCHGRLREQRGHAAGLASYAHIRAVKQNVSVPVFANGNILFQEDIDTCLRETGCDGVMSAEGILYNPALFGGLPASPADTPPTDADAALLVRHPPHTDLAQEYLAIVRTLHTTTSVSAIKGHLFKILRPALARHPDLRERLGRVKVDQPLRVKQRAAGEAFWETGLEPYAEVVQELAERLRADAERELQGEGKRKSVAELVRVQEGTGLKLMPWWLAQPYWRPLPEESPEQASAAATAKKKKRPHVVVRAESVEAAAEAVPESGPEKKLRIEAVACLT